MKIMKNTFLALKPALALASIAALIDAPAQAHFQELIPSADIVDETTGKTLTLDIVFTHPFEGGPVMDMGGPVQVGVLTDGRKQDLRPSLMPSPVSGKNAYRATFIVSAPGDYVFFIEPTPYWEAAERKMIVQYAKVVVDAFGAEQGWDSMVGLPLEIQPLVRPYGLWTGNIFRGVVRREGKPVPFADVEVEWRNDGTVKAPAGAFVTQLIKADGEGVFAYAMPRAGWWGFAAIDEGGEAIKSPTGEMVPVELGALMWVKAVDMK
jgi:cobalt/nickel transport protein